MEILKRTKTGLWLFASREPLASRVHQPSSDPFPVVILAPLPARRKPQRLDMRGLHAGT